MFLITTNTHHGPIARQYGPEFKGEEGNRFTHREKGPPAQQKTESHIAGLSQIDPERQVFKV